jgi:eukaryotic-like serine/threonine-protein kinase
VNDATDDRRSAYLAEKAALQRLLDTEGTARSEAVAALQRTQPDMAARVLRRLELAAVAAPAVVADDDAPPVITRYRIERELGRGGMGRVWLATRADGADAQQLAIKQIRADALDAQALRRFDAERRALARLDHPNIVPLLDAGSDASGQPYLVTAFVEGMPIGDYCDRHALTVRARVQLLRAVASALAHAHQQLIVHRDLKPANVLVEEGGRVRLLDFGIAKMLDIDTEATAAGASLMTLRYAAPEQLVGGGAGISCDLYSLGVLAYELLSGRSPYGDLREPAALIHAITQVDPLPLQRGHAAGGERIAQDLGAIVLKLLRKQPEHRYRSAEAVLDDVDRWLRREPVQAMRGRRVYQLRTWLRRRWIWIAAALAALGFLGLHVQRMDRQLLLTERERDKATEVSEFLIALFQSARPADTRQEAISALELLKRGAHRLLNEDDLDLSAEGRAALLFSTAHAFYQMDDQDMALRMFARAADLYAQSDTTPVATLSEALRFTAMAHYAKGDYVAALGKVQAARALLQKSGAIGGAEFASVVNATCVYFGSLGRVDDARACYQDLLAVHRKKDRPGIETVSAFVNIANFETAQGEPERAEALLREAMRLLPESAAYGFSESLPINLIGALAVSLREQERYAEAAKYYTQAVQETRQYEGEDARALTVYSTGLAASLTLDGRSAQAEVPMREAVRIAAAIYAPSQKNALTVRLEYARWLLARGRLSEARVELNDIQRLRKDQRPVDVSGDALALATIAHIDCLEGARDAGLRGFAQAFAILDKPGQVSRQRRSQAASWRAQCQATQQ